MTDAIHPRTAVGHYARLLTPGALSATRLGLERDARQRFTRIAAATRRRSSRDGDMRGLIAGPGGSLKWQRVPRPVLPGPFGALVRPVAVATCDADRPMMLGRTIFPLPLHLGHEAVADVVEVGEQVSAVGVGDRVVVPFQISCGHCPACRRGHTGSCLSVPPASMYGFGLTGGLWGGALADLMAVPFADAMLVPLPTGIDPGAAAGVADNICDAYRQVAPHLPQLLADDPDTEVLIVGRLHRNDPFTPSCLLFTALIAQALGARNISVVDARPALQRRAEELGFRVPDPGHPRSWPVAALTVDATGNPKGLRKVLQHTAADGICTCTWSMHRRGAVGLQGLYMRNITVHIGRSHIRTYVPEVLDLIATGRLQPELVTTDVATFDEAPAALREFCHSGALKTVLTA